MAERSGRPYNLRLHYRGRHDSADLRAGAIFLGTNSERWRPIKMQNYHVVWEMDIDADSPREAAEKALHYLKLPGTGMACFEVVDEFGLCCAVDLMERVRPQSFQR